MGRNFLDVIPDDKRQDIASFITHVRDHQFGYVSVRRKVKELGQKIKLKTIGLPLIDSSTGKKFLITVYQITHDSVRLSGNEVFDMFGEHERYTIKMLDIGNGLASIPDNIMQSLTVS